MLEYILLGFLMDSNKSGYDLKQWMINSTSYFFNASYGSIYPALKRLEKKSFITSREIKNNNKYKILYSITELGKSYFLSWLEKPIAFLKTKQDHLVPIFFYEHLPKQIAIINLNHFIEEVRPFFEQLCKQKTDTEKDCPMNQYICKFSTMNYGIQYYQFVIDWCTNLVSELEKS